MGKKEKCLLKSMSDTSVVLLAQTEFITIRHDTNSNNLPRGANRSSEYKRVAGTQATLEMFIISTWM